MTEVQPGYRRRPASYWERLRQQAVKGRPRPGAAVAAQPEVVPEQRLAAAGEVAKAGRILAALPPQAG
ncbi:hypothetical protein [Kitasatospora sp. NPDC050543]|uniref:hypothetical protein n=1 Tax=Kitasatospora sp. NPDC050543 TaxID=3364054 RepID=UPI00379F8675